MKIKEYSVTGNYDSNGLVVTYTPALVRKEGIKIKKAALKLQVNSATNEEGYLVKFKGTIIDKFYKSGSNGCVG